MTISSHLFKGLTLAVVILTGLQSESAVLQSAERTQSYLQSCAQLLINPASISDEEFFQSLYGLPNRNSGNQQNFVFRDRLGRKVGDIQIYVKNQTLRFDIDLKRRGQGRGLYSRLMALALDLHPEIESIPAQMPWRVSENAEIFVNSLFFTQDLNEVSELLEQCCSTFSSLHRMTRAQVISMRNRMVEAYYEMPAAKARVRSGFGQLAKLTLSADKECIEFNTVKGERSDAFAVPIFIVPKTGTVVAELKSNGQVSATGLAAIDVGADYKRVWTPCH